MTDLFTLMPEYPFVWVYPAKIRLHRSSDLVASRWIIDLFTDADTLPIIMDIVVDKPSLDELRGEFDCPVFMDEDE